jgi:hypothetical protein
MIVLQYLDLLYLVRCIPLFFRLAVRVRFTMPLLLRGALRSSRLSLRDRDLQLLDRLRVLAVVLDDLIL